MPLVFCFRFLVREFSVVLVPPRVPHGRSIVRVFNAFLLPLRFDEAFFTWCFRFLRPLLDCLPCFCGSTLRSFPKIFVRYPSLFGPRQPGLG